MSKINQIERALQELSGGDFQKLADAYLYKKGFRQINAIGSVIGKNKVRKGTPDTLIPLSNGKYVFAEYTTESGKRLFNKLQSDLAKCLNNNKTGIPLEAIQEIVFCHTSILNTSQENVLTDQCKKLDINLNIFGLSVIAYDLYLKYPGLARDFLNISIDTGQIVSSEDFVNAYNKNALATPLDTEFHFREKEVNQVLQQLEETNLVIVSGKAGVGKSRLALECCSRFHQIHPEYLVRCIFNRGVDLFDDLRVHFSDSGHFLIFVDDANRISRFESILQLLHDQTNDQKIKIIVSVRDYALDKIKDTARSYDGWETIELEPMSDEQIKQLVEDDFNIRNHFYKDRIAEISKGNPRLAVMAAQVAQREDTLESIRDVSALYDEYFSSIRKELTALNDKDLLKTAGIISFFRYVDRTNVELMEIIERIFHISTEVFWETVLQLHTLEVVDQYENEVVRITDQVLSTYLFYLVFFKEKLFSFSLLLEHLFPDYRHRMMDALNPLFNAFDHTRLIDEMRPAIKRLQKLYTKSGEDNKLLELMNSFWFIDKTATLVYLRDKITDIEVQATDIAKTNFESKSNVPSPSLLSILRHFQYTEEPTFKIALSLLLDYSAKDLQQMPYIIHLLLDDYGYSPYSYLSKYERQWIVIAELWKRTNEGRDFIFVRLFVVIAQHYLHTNFHRIESKQNSSFSMINFQLSPSKELYELRDLIWEKLFYLYEQKEFSELIISLFLHYSTSGQQVSSREIVENDAKSIFPFIEKAFNPEIYQHCRIVHRYLDHLEWCKVPVPEDLRERYKNHTFRLAEVIVEDWNEKKAWELELDEYWQYKKKCIKEFFVNFDFEAYKTFFDECVVIQKELENKSFQLNRGVIEVFIDLAERDANLFVKVFVHYLMMGNPLEISGILPMQKLIHICGKEKAYEIINRYDYSWKHWWLFTYFQSLTAKEIRHDHLQELYILYQEAKSVELPDDMDFLLNFKKFDSDVVPNVTQIILNRAITDAQFRKFFQAIFHPAKQISKQLTSHFKQHVDLLKKIYLMNLEYYQYIDHRGKIFAEILDLDPDFVLYYIENIYAHEDFIQRHDDTRDYAFIWRRVDYEKLVADALDRIYQIEQERMGFGNTFIEALLKIHANNNDHVEIQNRQDQFLARLIKMRINDSEFIKFLFDLICQFSKERRIRFIKLFLELNKQYEDFRRLSLEPRVRSWSGSAVPGIQEQIDYYQSMLPLLNEVELLDHRQYLNRRIQGLREYMESEKKRDFISD